MKGPHSEDKKNLMIRLFRGTEETRQRFSAAIWWEAPRERK